MSSEHLVIKSKLPRDDDGYKVFSIHIKEELVMWMDDIAAQTGRSRNELISTFIEYALDRCIIETTTEE